MEFPNELCEVPDMFLMFGFCPTVLEMGVRVKPEEGSADDKRAEL